MVKKQEQENQEEVIEDKYSSEEKKELELIKINTKLEKNQELTPEEIMFYNKSMEEEQERINANKQLLVQQELEKQARFEQEVREEFSQADEEEKLTHKDKGVKIKGKPSPIKQFLWKRKIKKAVKSGGSLIIKGYKDSSLELVFSKKPVRYVEFKGRSEQGEDTNYITRITKTKHRLKGSSVPLHICLEGIAENMNLYEGAETNLSADYVNKWGAGLFHSGILKGMAMKDQAGIGKSLENVIPLLLFINIALMIIVGYLLFEMWGIVADVATAMGV